MKANGLLAVFAVVLPVVACAGPANSVQRAQDRREIRADKARRYGDWRDLNRLQGVLAKLDAARASNNAAGLAAVDEELRALVARELGEDRVEVAQARAEVRRDNREVRSENRDLRHDIAMGKPGQAMNDLHDRRDDLRDRRDDIRDTQVAKADLNRTRAIARELNSLAGRYDAPSLNRKRALITDLIALAKVEVVQDRRELHEDRRELREDRRETREDRRNGR
jgi:hypothetical protein